jgi:prolyl-tRNA synthetase
LVGKKTEREKFKGAVYTTTLEAMMPDGKAIQMGTSHHLGQNFSKPFEIKYLGKDEKEHFAWTTSWGISWRLIGATILTHGDDKGLVLPPRVAPTQVVFVPIHYKESDKEIILHTARHTATSLEKHSIRTFIDDREQYTPGWKYHEWEMKGAPLRVEIGPRDMQSKQITLVRRDTGKKSPVPQAEAATHIVNLLDEIQQTLLQRARETLEKLTSNATNMKELAHLIETTGGFVRAYLSENTDCEDKIKQETGATVRIVPFKESAKGKCVLCGSPNSREVYFARSY